MGKRKDVPDQSFPEEMKARVIVFTGEKATGKTFIMRGMQLMYRSARMRCNILSLYERPKRKWLELIEQERMRCNFLLIEIPEGEKFVYPNTWRGVVCYQGGGYDRMGDLAT